VEQTIGPRADDGLRCAAYVDVTGVTHRQRLAPDRVLLAVAAVSAVLAIKAQAEEDPRLLITTLGWW
jgi:hypothetical protein